MRPKLEKEFLMKNYSNILIDILTPKQALFFGKLAERLQENGYIVHMTTRRYYETISILKRSNINAKIIGEYRKTLQEKLFESLNRTQELARHIHDSDIDLTISFSSVEAARASFGLSIPHFCVSDSPHANAVSRLTIPLSEKLFSPKTIPRKEWTKYGIHPKKIITYDAIDPVVWVRDTDLDKDDLASLKLNFDRNIITIRLEETFASYLLDQTNKQSSITFEVVRRLIEEKFDAQIVVLPRYKEQIFLLKQKFSDKIIIPSGLVYGPSLLSVSDAFIGGGGTMTAEAALLGIPTVSCFPGGSTYIEQFLSKHSLLKRFMNVEKIIIWASKVLAGKVSKKNLKRKARILMDTMEDPLEVIISELKVKS